MSRTFHSVVSGAGNSPATRSLRAWRSARVCSISLSTGLAGRGVPRSSISRARSASYSVAGSAAGSGRFGISPSDVIGCSPATSVSPPCGIACLPKISRSLDHQLVLCLGARFGGDSRVELRSLPVERVELEPAVGRRRLLGLRPGLGLRRGLVLGLASRLGDEPLELDPELDLVGVDRRRVRVRPVRLAGIGARRANLLRTEPRGRGRAGDRESARDLWKASNPAGRRDGCRRRAPDHIAGADPEPARAGG